MPSTALAWTGAGGMEGGVAEEFSVTSVPIAPASEQSCSFGRAGVAGVADVGQGQARPTTAKPQHWFSCGTLLAEHMLHEHVHHV